MLDIVLTDNAKVTLQHLFDRVEYRFGATTADEFLDKVEKVLKQVAQNPEMFKAVSFLKNVRIAFVSRQTAFYYQINNQDLVILYFWDNRQEPLFD